MGDCDLYRDDFLDRPNLKSYLDDEKCPNKCGKKPLKHDQKPAQAMPEEVEHLPQDRDQFVTFPDCSSGDESSSKKAKLEKTSFDKKLAASKKLVIDSSLKDLLNLRTKTVYVRDQYSHLLQYWDYVKHLYLLGTPGTGKTVLGHLAFLRELADGDKAAPLVYILQRKGKDYRELLVIGNDMYTKDIDGILRRKGLQWSEATVIYDGTEGAENVLQADIKKVLVVHSPSADLTSTQKYSNTIQKALITPWSFDEVREWNEMYLKEEIAELEEKFSLIGGVMRYLLKDVISIKNDIEDSVTKTTGNPTWLATEILHLAISPKEGDVAHRILRLFSDKEVPKDENEMKQYAEMKIEGLFLTDYILEQVINSWAKKHEFNIYKTLSCSDFHAGYRGQMLEYEMHKLLDGTQFSKLTFEVRKLQDEKPESKETKSFEIDLARVPPHRFYHSTEIDKDTKLQVNQYTHPRYGNFPGIDGGGVFEIEDVNTAVFLQCTVAQSHGVKKEGLEKMSGALTRVGIEYDRRILAFFVPKNVAEMGFEKKQKIVVPESGAPADWMVNNEKMAQEVWVISSATERESGKVRVIPF